MIVIRCICTAIIVCIIFDQPARILYRRYRSGVKLIRPGLEQRKFYVGDCTDEMLEAMREVDALTPSVPPMLTPIPNPGEPVTKPKTYEEQMREFLATFGVHGY